MVSLMSEQPQKEHLESIGESAARLLAKLNERTKRRAGQIPAANSNEIGRVPLAETAGGEITEGLSAVDRRPLPVNVGDIDGIDRRCRNRVGVVAPAPANLPEGTGGRCLK